jgi:hypothetical protein
MASWFCDFENATVVCIAAAQDGSEGRATVLWYSWKQELPKAARRTVKSDFEVFLNLQPFDTEIDLETVLDVVQVV